MSRSSLPAALTELLPSTAVGPVQAMLEMLPIRIRLQGPRSSKLGDYRPSRCGQWHEITLNKLTNPYQFLITLLHEVAHALTAQRHGTRVEPHGAEWKGIFGQLLHDFLVMSVFPTDLHAVIKRHAQRPTFSSLADAALQRALRKYEPGTPQLTVEELPQGQIFVLSDGLVLIKGRLLRKFYECHAFDDKKYRVSPLAKVQQLLTVAEYRQRAG
jgi:SprT protein